jgi:hypothetical protein
MSRKCWIAVASAEHVRLGRVQGFMQVCHGKVGPLRRVSPGDGVAYYSPTLTFGGKDRLQAFTAIGTVAPGVLYQADMGGGFRPFRQMSFGTTPSRRRSVRCSATSRLRATTRIGGINFASVYLRSQARTWQ